MEFIGLLFMGKPVWMWLAFAAIVVFLLVLDLGVLHKKQKEIGVRESLVMSAFYIAISLIFGGWIWHTLGNQSGQEFITAFLVEKTLAMDNVFLISLIFTFLAIPPQYQHRVLFWGILGVIVLRGIMVALGATLVAEFHWILYIFAVFLIFTGFKMLFMGDHGHDMEQNPLLKFMRKRFNITNELHEQRFFVKQPDPKTGKLVTWITPLFVALALIEFIDLIFAVDSIPAVFAITTDPFIVYTSNIFAILGLRALYFALAAVIDRFTYLKQALAMVLIFIGSKIFIADLMGWEKFPATVSLGITLALIAGGVIYSLYKTKDQKGARI